MNTMTAYKIGDHPNKAAVIDNYRNINVEDFEWWDGVYEIWKERLEALGYSNPEIQFSGFWCQGDGASFTCDQVPLPSTDASVQEAWNSLVGAAALLGETVTENINDLAYGKVYRTGHSYSHENTVSVDWEWNDPPYGRYCSRVEPDALAPFIDALVEAVKDYFNGLEESVRDLCREIYRDLRSEYEYLTSDEAVEETLEANDYEFDEEGVIV